MREKEIREQGHSDRGHMTSAAAAVHHNFISTSLNINSGEMGEKLTLLKINLLGLG